MRPTRGKTACTYYEGASAALTDREAAGKINSKK